MAGMLHQQVKQDRKQVSVRGLLQDIKTKVVKGEVIVEYFEIEIIDISFLAGGHAAGDGSLPNTLDGSTASPRRNGFLQFRSGSPLKPGQQPSNSGPVKRASSSVSSSPSFSASSSGVRETDGGTSKRPRVQDGESPVTAAGIVFVDPASRKGKERESDAN